MQNGTPRLKSEVGYILLLHIASLNPDYDSEIIQYCAYLNILASYYMYSETHYIPGAPKYMTRFCFGINHILVKINKKIKRKVRANV